MHDSSANQLLRAIIFLVVFTAIFAVHGLFYAFLPNFYDPFIKGEDRAVEWITFMGFLFGGVILLSLHRYRSRMSTWTRLYLLGLGLFFVLCAGEEISWGQRILGFETPEAVAEINEQGEFNVHNLNLEHLHPKDIVSWFMKLFGMILPLTAALLSLRWRFPFFRYLPPLALIPCFLFPEVLNLWEAPISEFIADLAHSTAPTASAASHAEHLEELKEMYWGLSAMLAAAGIRFHWAKS